MVEVFLDPSDLSYLYLRVLALGAWVGPGHCSVNGQGVAFFLEDTHSSVLPLPPKSLSF